MRVGIAGLGRMGTAIARRLMESGVEISVWNRSPSKYRTLIDAGVVVCGTPRALADRSDLIITMMFDGHALHDVFEGETGFLEANLTGKLFVEMSTVRPEVEEAMAARVAERGGAFMECPVGGTVGPAREGKLGSFPLCSAADR